MGYTEVVSELREACIPGGRSAVSWLKVGLDMQRRNRTGDGVEYMTQQALETVARYIRPTFNTKELSGYKDMISS
jgi:hypothetical protein